MTLLQRAHSEANLPQVMCRSLISVDWHAHLYEYDFNQMLGLPLGVVEQRRHIAQLTTEHLVGRPAWVSEHCYGRTAGAGSNCGGALEHSINNQ